ASCRQFDVLTTECRLNIGNSQTTCCQRNTVQPYTHGITAGTPYGNTGNTINYGKLVSDVTLCVIVQLQEGHLGAGQVKERNRTTVSVGLGNCRRIHILWQTTCDTGYLVTDIVSSLVDIPAYTKFNRNPGTAVTAVGVDSNNPFHTIDLVLNELGNLGFHNLCGSTGVAGADRYNGRTGIRVLTYRQLKEGQYSQHNQQQADYCCKYRAFD